jgi:hypothetical protein
MNNNDIFKKLRVALQLRDDQIIEICELVDFRVSKGEIGNIFRAEDHADFMPCGDQILRNFLNGLVIYLRGTKENPKNPNEVLKKIKAEIKPLTETNKTFDENRGEQKPKVTPKAKKPFNPKSRDTKSTKIQVVEKVKFNNGKQKKK